MKKIAILPSPGLGDAMIMQIASYNLALAGYETTLVTPHRFGAWLQGFSFQDQMGDCDAIFLQHDNTEKSEAIRCLDKPVYTFYGSHHLSKHSPLRSGFDYVCDPNRTMVDNVVTSLQVLFKIPARKENGLKAPSHLVHRKHSNRVALQTTTAVPARNWPLAKFEKLASWLKTEGFDPVLVPLFPTLEELFSFIYESGYFIGNDSGPGHVASLLQIPHLIIGRSYRHMLFWRPGWLPGEIVVPSRWIPNWKGWRMREKYWKHFIPVNQVIHQFNILRRVI